MKCNTVYYCANENVLNPVTNLRRPISVGYCLSQTCGDLYLPDIACRKPAAANIQQKKPVAKLRRAISCRKSLSQNCGKVLFAEKMSKNGIRMKCVGVVRVPWPIVVADDCYAPPHDE